MPILPNNTLSSIVNLVNRAGTDSAIQPPLPRAGFTLDASGVAGFFGGDTAVRAMATAYLLPKHRWLGWYNGPGAYEVAKQYSGIVKSDLFDVLFPSGDGDPRKIFTLVDRQVDPEYTQLYPLTGNPLSSIGPLGSLIVRYAFQVPGTAPELGMKHTMDTLVTFVHLCRVPGKLHKLDLLPSTSIIFTFITILISVGGCIACALVADWFCFASIALGIITNGLACSVIGSGGLYIKNSPSSQAGSPGDILLRINRNILILVGEEGMVHPLTHGRFVLHFGDTTEENGVNCKGDTGKDLSWNLQRHLVHIAVILLLLQFLGQLLLIPQGTLFGQLMFVGTLVSSWMYHLYMSTLCLDLQTLALFHILSIHHNDIFQCKLNTWTQAAVFTCLAFRSIHPPVYHSSYSNAHKQMQEDVLLVEATEWEEQLKASQRKAGKMSQAHIKAAQDAKEAERAQQDADAEVEVAEAEVKVVEAEVKAAEVEVHEAQKAKTQEQVKEAQDKKVAAEKVVEDKKEEAKTKKEEARKKKAVKMQKDSEAKAAKVVAYKENRTMATMFTEELNKLTEAEQNAMKKQENEKRARQQEKADKAFQALLDALLPGQTDVERAFKESLLRKLSKVNNTSSWVFMKDKTLEFNDDDTFFGVHGGAAKVLGNKDMDELYIYQEDAKRAFIAWRERRDSGIVEQFSYFGTM